MEEQRTSARHDYDNRDSHHVITYELDSRQLLTHFPREPAWWRDSDAMTRREAIYADFDPFDLTTLADDLVLLTTDLTTNVEGVAALVRRQWSLSWLAEVARGALAQPDSVDAKDQALAMWHMRAAVYLADATWRFVMEQPPELVNGGVRLALARPFEIHNLDEE